MTNKELFYCALKARLKAYAPYSEFKVGAALVTKEGNIYLGCNVENKSYPVTLCAERNAFSTAIAAGEKEFEKIAIVGGKEGLIKCPPCGMCRQFMQEFCDANFKIILGIDQDNLEEYSLSELLPEAF